MVITGSLLLVVALFPSVAGASGTGGAGPGPGTTSTANSTTTTTSTTPPSAQPPGVHGGPPVPIAAAPPMGWDSWDTFGCNVNEQDIEQTANWLVLSGMRDAGYRLVIIDDCWFNPTRAPDGSLRADAKKFPSGMRYLGWYLHQRGLLFGIYESAGPSTCAQLNSFYPGSTGSLGHEYQDARTFASWGVDYLKFDWCSRQSGLQAQITEFTTMRDALRATGRPIIYSINPNSFQSTPTGASYNWSSIANVVRTGPDTAAFWNTSPEQNWFGGVLNEIGVNAPLWGRAGPGHWNDPDILVVGLESEQFAAAVGATGLDALLSPPLGGPENALSYQAMRSNMAMWAMMASPLIVGYDVRYLSPYVSGLLLNKWLIQIDQDPLAQQGHPIGSDDEVWVKPLTGGAFAVALFNPSNDALAISTQAGTLRLPRARRYNTVNVWTGNHSSTRGLLHYLVPAHGTVVYLVTPVIAPPKVTKTTNSHSTTPGSGTGTSSGTDKKTTSGTGSPGK